MLEHAILFTPWLVLCAGILLTLLVSVIRTETKRPAQIFSIISLAATLVTALPGVYQPAQTIFSGAVEVSPLTHLILVLLCFLGILFVVGGSRYLTKERLHLSDYYHLTLILILGASVLASAKDLIVMFIALEVMSLPAYTLTGFRRNDARSNEASIKYYILGGALGAVFLLGSSFLFGATGSTNLGDIFNWSLSANGDLTLFYMGHILVLIAFLFKVAAVPFHFWKPDVYEGAPITVTGIMATVVSTAAFITLARLLHVVNLNAVEWSTYAEQLKTLIRVLAAASLMVGTTVLITQTNLKRMLAYSSISNTGYLLLGLLGSFYHEEQIYSLFIYLFGYTMMTAGLFILLSHSETKSDASVELVDLTGLLKKAPFNAFLWSIFLFSMAGMPLTVGFFTKYSVFMSAIEGSETPVVVIAALCTVVGAYAYLRPIALMMMRDADPSAGQWRGSVASYGAVILSAIIVISLGIAPSGMIHLLKGIQLIH